MSGWENYSVTSTKNCWWNEADVHFQHPMLDMKSELYERVVVSTMKCGGEKRYMRMN